MNIQETVYFVTSNEKKFTSLKQKLTPLNINVERLVYDFDEGRELSIERVAENKLAQAKHAFPNKRLIVDDRGFFIPALKGFPGPFVKLLLESFSYKGLLKLMSDEVDRSAIFSYAVGYFDGIKNTVLIADEVGFIIDVPKGNNLHGWTELLYVYGYKTFPNRSLAELDDLEWVQYLNDIEGIDPFALLKKYLSENI